MRKDVLLGIGDDAALVEASGEFASASASLTGDDCLGSPKAVTDCVARACAALAVPPRWALLSLTLPVADAARVEALAESLHAALEARDIALIGGDTTRGPARLVLMLSGVAGDSGKAATTR